MERIKEPQLNDIQDSPEVKAFIYQAISEFEPFVTPQTLVAVVAKDPMKSSEELLESASIESHNDLKKWHRISITLKEGDQKVEAEAMDKDIFTAIRLAKNKLLQHLSSVQDSVVSQQERIAEINQIMQNNLLH